MVNTCIKTVPNYRHRNIFLILIEIKIVLISVGIKQEISQKQNEESTIITFFVLLACFPGLIPGLDQVLERFLKAEPLMPAGVGFSHVRFLRATQPRALKHWRDNDSNEKELVV